jgi:hypothetical protein
VLAVSLLNKKQFFKKIFILPFHDAVEVFLKGDQVIHQSLSQLLRLRGEENRDRAGQAARTPEGGPADGPGARHRRRHVDLTKEGRGLHFLGGQRNDLQLQLEIAFGGGADYPAVRAADDLVLPPFCQSFEERLALVRRFAGQLYCDQPLADAGKRKYVNLILILAVRFRNFSTLIFLFF